MRVVSRKKLLNTPVFNQLGLQVCRVAAARAAFRLRHLVHRGIGLGPPVSPAAEQLVREGYCAIENFLPPDEFAAVVEELERGFERERSVLSHKGPDEYGVCDAMLKNRPASDWRRTHPVTWSRFFANPEVSRLIAYADARSERYIQTRAKLLFKTERISRRFASDPSHGADDSRRNATIAETSVSNFHADTFYSVFKVFLYTEDVDEHNAAYEHAIRSHRLSPWRLAFEYRNSTERRHGTPRITRAAVARHFETKVLCYPANTLVATNTFGFHRRGLLEHVGDSRTLAKIVYRPLPFL